MSYVKRIQYFLFYVQTYETLINVLLILHVNKSLLAYFLVNIIIVF